MAHPAGPQHWAQLPQQQHIRQVRSARPPTAAATIIRICCHICRQFHVCVIPDGEVQLPDDVVADPAIVVVAAPAAVVTAAVVAVIASVEVHVKANKHIEAMMNRDKSILIVYLLKF